jgi:DNA-binding transcriptional regulator/RsmH inhibitor MraZ
MAAVAQSSIDSQGRINLPDHLRAYANLGKDATLIGAANHIAIFPAEVHSPEAALDDLIDVSDLL